MRRAARALALVAPLVVAGPVAGSTLLAPLFIDFRPGAVGLDRAGRRAIEDATHGIRRYREDTRANLCARGEPALGPARVAAVRDMLRRRGMKQVVDEPERCAEMISGDNRPGVLIIWWPQWR